MTHQFHYLVVHCRFPYLWAKGDVCKNDYLMLTLQELKFKKWLFSIASNSKLIN